MKENEFLRLLIDKFAKVLSAGVKLPDQVHFPPAEKLLEQSLELAFIPPQGFTSFEKFLQFNLTLSTFDATIRLKQSQSPCEAIFEKVWINKTEIGFLVSIKRITTIDSLPEELLKQALNSSSEAWLVIETNSEKQLKGLVRYCNSKALRIFDNCVVGSYFTNVLKANADNEVSIDGVSFYLSVYSHTTSLTNKYLKLLVLKPV